MQVGTDRSNAEERLGGGSGSRDSSGNGSRRSCLLLLLLGGLSDNGRGGGGNGRRGRRLGNGSRGHSGDRSRNRLRLGGLGRDNGLGERSGVNLGRLGRRNNLIDVLAKFNSAGVGYCSQRTRSNLLSLGGFRHDGSFRLDLRRSLLLRGIRDRGDRLSWNIVVRAVHLGRYPHLAAFQAEHTGRGRGSSLSAGGLGGRDSGLDGLVSRSSLGGSRLLLEGGLELGLQVVEGVES